MGITRKNIRFYEEQGLLNVERAENGYREYHKEDVIRLQEIKLFRKMDISIEDMRALFEKKKSLQICLEQHLKELKRRKEGISKMQDICERLILEHRSLDNLNVEDCLEEMEQMENRSYCRCSSYDCTYGIHHGNDVVGEFTGSYTVGNVSASSGNPSCDHYRNISSTCRKNERNRRRRRG